MSYSAKIKARSLLFFSVELFCWWVISTPSTSTASLLLAMDLIMSTDKHYALLVSMFDRGAEESISLVHNKHTRVICARWNSNWRSHLLNLSRLIKAHRKNCYKGLQLREEKHWNEKHLWTARNKVWWENGGGQTETLKNGSDKPKSCSTLHFPHHCALKRICSWWALRRNKPVYWKKNWCLYPTFFLPTRPCQKCTWLKWKNEELW